METFQIRKVDLEFILQRANEMGRADMLFQSGNAPSVISQSRAYRQFVKSRVQNWVRDGRISPISNGNGKTSTVFYKLDELLKLDASDKVIIRKSYIQEKK